MKQYDLYMGESGGKEETIEEMESRINDTLGKHPELSPLVKQLDEAIDNTYNIAVGHCIGITKVFLSQVPGLAEPLISKLEALKKPIA